MVRKVNCIEEINDSKETWKLAVRIVNIWTIHRSPKPTIEMVFLDNKGDKIVAQVKNVDTEKWKDELKEGKAYIVQNFEVEANTGQYKASNHRYKLIFVKGTKMKEQDFPEIPQYLYKFTQFEAILNKSACANVLIVQWYLDGKPKKVVFLMKDRGGTILTCTLWEAFAFKLKDFLDKHEYGPIVVLLHLAKIKESRGNFPVSIQNSMHGSRLLINEKIKDIDDFKNSLDPTQLSAVSYSQRTNKLSLSSQLSSEDRFLHNAQVLALSDIREVKKDCFCVTVGTISKLLVANG